MSWVDQNNPSYVELRDLDATLLDLVEKRDSAALLLKELPNRYTFVNVAAEGPQQRAWELLGLIHKDGGRIREALAIFWHLYQHMLLAQQQIGRVHKAMPLVWMSDCFERLGFTVHAKRYLMLTLVEDALRESGEISPETTGTYFRLVWGHGLTDQQFHEFAKQFFALAKKLPDHALFPEALLQGIDDDWLTELPSTSEGSSYRINPQYVNYLLKQLGDGKGEGLERLRNTSCLAWLDAGRCAANEVGPLTTPSSAPGRIRGRFSLRIRPLLCLRVQRLEQTSRLQCHGEVLSSVGLHQVAVRGAVFKEGHNGRG